MIMRPKDGDEDVVFSSEDNELVFAMGNAILQVSRNYGANGLEMLGALEILRQRIYTSIDPAAES